MKKLFLLLVAFALFFVKTSYAQQIVAPSPFLVGEHIQNFDADIDIVKDGTVNVKETIVYDFGSLNRHGIFRNIPIIKTNQEGKRFRLDYTNISVTDDGGEAYQFQESEGDGILELKIGDPDSTTTGVHTYVITYTVSGALTYFSDHDELYWNVTGNEWTVPIAKANTTVTLPTAVAEDELKTECYTGPDGSQEQACVITATDQSSSVTSQDLFESGEGMTIVAMFPKNIAAVLEPKPYITFWESIWGKITSALILLAALLWYLVYPIWIPIKWLRQGRDPKVVGGGETRAWFDPPKDDKNRPITPGEVGTLLDERAELSDLSAMIVSLAQRGCMKIEEREKNTFYLVKGKKTGSGLMPFESNFLQQLFATGDEVSLKNRSDLLYNTVEEAKKALYDQVVADGFFAKNPNTVRNFYTGIGALALTTFNPLLAFSAFFFGRNMPKKTPEGVAAAAVSKSLRNFLSSQERQLEHQAKNQVFFEKLLPFAVAFGVERIWAKRFEDIVMKPPEWYQGYSTSGFNSVRFSNSLHSSFSSLGSAATPKTSSSGFSSGGGGGGSSGGGGGGGGGGSW